MLDNSIDEKHEPVHIRRPSASILMKPPQGSPVPAREASAEVPHIWCSCCIERDSRALLFFSQLLITWLILGFCSYGVVSLPEIESQWQRMTISLLCGIWLLAPRVQKWFNCWVLQLSCLMFSVCGLMFSVCSFSCLIDYQNVSLLNLPTFALIDRPTTNKLT